MDPNIVFLSVLILLFVSLLGIRNWIFIGVCTGVLMNYIGYANIDTLDFGVLLTMLAIGMHVDLSVLSSRLRTILALLLSTILTIGLNFGICMVVLETSQFNSLLIGASLSLSSTIVTYQILRDSNAMAADYGIDSMFATIIQDCFGIACLLLVENRNFDIVLGLKYISVVLGFIALRFVINIVIPDLQKTGITSLEKNDLNVIGLLSLMVIFISNWLHRYGVSKEIVFLAFGVVFKRGLLWYDLIIEMLQRVFLIYIFISSGYSTDIFGIASYCKKAIELLIMVHLIKFIVNYSILSLVNRNKFTNIRIAIITASASELTYFIVSLLSLKSSIRSALNLVTTVSILLTPVVFDRVNKMILSYYKRTFGIAKHAARIYISHLNYYVLVIGINDTTRLLNDMLGIKAISAVLIDNDIDIILRYQNSNYFYMDGIFSETYEALGIKKMLCIVIQSTTVSRLEGTLKTIRKHTMLCQIYVLCSRENVDVALKYEAIPVILTNRSSEEVVDDVVTEISHLLTNNISMI